MKRAADLLTEEIVERSGDEDQGLGTSRPYGGGHVGRGQKTGGRGEESSRVPLIPLDARLK
jgi:hypothetical protein